MKTEKQNPTGEKSAKADKYSFFTGSFYPYIIIVIVTFVVYFQVIAFGLIVFDDLKIIERAKSYSEQNVFETAFKNDAYFKSSINSNFYRPVQNLSILVDSRISGDGYKAYHITNLLIHILTVLVLFRLLGLMKFSRLIALFCSLLFAVHPLFAFNVAWIASRGDLLATLFSLLSFLFFIRYLESKRKLSLMLNVSFLFLGILSKETAIVLPLLFLSYVIFFEAKPRKKISSFDIKQIIMIICGWIVPIVAYFLLKSAFIPEGLTQFSFGTNEFISNLRYFPEYFFKAFLPINLSGMSSFNNLRIIIGISIILILSAVIIIYPERTSVKKFVFCCLWIALFLLPVIAFKPVYLASGEYWEHRAYMPMTGLFIMMAVIFSKLNFKTEGKILPSSLLIILLSVITLNTAKNYSGPFNYFNNIIKQGNGLPNAFYGRGFVYQETGQYVSAVNDMTRAIELKNDYYDAYFKRGIIYNEMNKPDKALPDFIRAAALKPELPQAYFNLSICYYKLKDYQKSYDSMEKSLKIDPNQERGNEILSKLKELMNSQTAVIK